ncbi:MULTISPECIES: hypothetical protein [unclassified Streptomyces]|nr:MULTISPECIES: hypothetical protein [unclassified Streptomyces]
MEHAKYKPSRRPWLHGLALGIAGGLATELLLWAGRVVASITGIR